jgi:putative transposase
MSNSYYQFHHHFVFTPKFRAALINPEWEERLHKYITGIVQKNKHKMLAINGTEDHIHMLIGHQPSQSISDLMQDVKADSSQWININKLCKSRFEWQSGYGGFSYSKSQVPGVIRYIQNQKEHHRKITFLEEYKVVLNEFEIEYNENYIFKKPE